MNLHDATNIYVGDKPAKVVYIGSKQIWPPTPPPNTPLFEGGDNTWDADGYRYHEFTTVGEAELTMIQPGEVEYLVVDGGAGGGSGRGGGGGGGLVQEGVGGGGLSITTTQTVTVGGGGDGGTGGFYGDAGLPSSIGSLLVGGISGYGGGSNVPRQGADGTTGGGGGVGTSAGAGGAGSQGGSGANGYAWSPASGRAGGGGGGAGTDGQLGTVGIGGSGGDGVLSTITGGTYGAGGNGGNGSPTANGVDGAPGTGNGGGGSSGTGGTGGAGGSGYVLIRYPVPEAPEPQTSFTDNFTRADAATLGSPWEEYAQSGTADFGVLDNRGRTTRSTAGVVRIAAVVDLGTSIGTSEWDLTTWPKGPVYSIFRFVDLDNYWSVSGTATNAGTMYLFRMIDGSSTMMGTATGMSWGAGHRLSVEDTGSLITVKVNGVVVPALTSSDTTHSTATRSGIGGNAQTAAAPLASARWSRFYIEAR